MSAPTDTVQNNVTGNLAPWARMISSIVISGLARDNAGNLYELQVPRESPAQYFLKETWPQDYYVNTSEKKTKSKVVDTAAPPALSNEEPDGTLQVRVVLGQLISKNDSASVYEATLSSDHPQSAIAIPPRVVVKIANQTEGRCLSEEAGAYDVLRGLQGTVVPHCYGYFRRFVNLQELTLVSWDPKCKFPRSKGDFDIYRMPHPSASLNILLLERLGKTLSQLITRDAVPETTLGGLKKVFTDMYLAAADIGVAHGDISARNILEAAPSDDVQSPTLATSSARPGSRRWRLIDWEDATTPKLTRKSLRSVVFTAVEDAINEALHLKRVKRKAGEEYEEEDGEEEGENKEGGDEEDDEDEKDEEDEEDEEEEEEEEEEDEDEEKEQ